MEQLKALMDKNPKVDRQRLAKDQDIIERAKANSSTGSGYRLVSPYSPQGKMVTGRDGKPQSNRFSGNLRRN